VYEQDLAYIQSAGFGALARGAATEIVRRLRRATIPIRRVVDVGCGAGPLSQTLVEAGFEVTGIDCSAELLTLARAATPSAHFIHASIYEVEIPECDAILAMGEPLTYHAEGLDAERRVRGFFQSASSALPNGGMLIFDIIERSEPALTARVWSSGIDWAVMVDTQEDQASHSLVRHIETFRRTGECYRRGREVHRVHLFDSAALREELILCGFKVDTAQAYGIHALAPRRRAFFAVRIR
jgi:SAM-dependent methyltransferase